MNIINQTLTPSAPLGFGINFPFCLIHSVRDQKKMMLNEAGVQLFFFSGRFFLIINNNNENASKQYFRYFT